MTKPDKKRLRPATEVAHAGVPGGENAPLSLPVVSATTYRFASSKKLDEYLADPEGSDAYFYSRLRNPTVRAAEEALARVCQAEECVLFASGMAAVTASILTFARAGEQVIVPSAIYGGTWRILRDLLSRFGVGMRVTEPAQLAEACADPQGSRLCLFESPINPTLRLLDVEGVCATARRSGVVTVMDATFGPPPLQSPLALGLDVALHSTTKYLNGHSDQLGGALVGSRTRLAEVRKVATQLGACVDAHSAYALVRGVRTLHVRVRQQSETALALSRWLFEQPAVTRVLYPGLPSHPDHPLAQRTMKGGYGGMITFSLGTRERALRAWDRLSVIERAGSLGGIESVASLPILFSHGGYSPAELAAAGIDEGMIRLSVGLEDVDDLREDLAQALAGL